MASGTVTLLATSYAPYSTTATITNYRNAYTNTSSTTYASVTSSSSNTASKMFFYGFDFSQIPNGVIIDSITYKIKVRLSDTSSSRYIVGLYNRHENANLSATQQVSTSVTTYTLTSYLTPEEIIALGNSFAFGVTVYSASVTQLVYGMEVIVEYSDPPVCNKLNYNSNIKFDLTTDDIDKESVANNKTFHSPRGIIETGNFPVINTTTFTPTADSLTISFDVLKEPTFFICIINNSYSTLQDTIVMVVGSNDFIYVLVADGDNNWEQTNLPDSDMIWSYSNGVLTITRSNTTDNGEFVGEEEYSLFYI